MLRWLWVWLRSRRIFRAINSLLAIELERVLNNPINSDRDNGPRLPRDNFSSIISGLPREKREEGSKMLNDLLAKATEQAYNERGKRGDLNITLREAWKDYEELGGEIQSMEERLEIDDRQSIESDMAQTKAEISLANRKIKRLKSEIRRWFGLIGILLFAELYFTWESAYKYFENPWTASAVSILTIWWIWLVHLLGSKYREMQNWLRKGLALSGRILVASVLTASLLLFRFLPYGLKFNDPHWIALFIFCMIGLTVAAFVISDCFWKIKDLSKKVKEILAERDQLQKGVDEYDYYQQELERKKQDLINRLEQLKSSRREFQEIRIPSLENERRSTIESEVAEILNKISGVTWEISRGFARWQIDDESKGGDKGEGAAETSLVRFNHLSHNS